MPKSTLWKMVILGVKVGILMKNRKKMEKSQIRNSFLLIHCNLLLLRTLRYNNSTKNVYQNQPRGKWLFFG